jgi:hypothetical protein
MIDQCQICGAEITCVEETDECSVESVFCSVCLGRGDWSQVSAEKLKAQLIQTFEENMDMANAEALGKANEILSDLESMMTESGTHGDS